MTPFPISIVRGSSAARGVLDGLGHCSSRLQLSRKMVIACHCHVKCSVAHLDRCSWKAWMEGVVGGWYVSWWRCFCHWTPPQINGKHDIDLSPPGEKALLAMVIHHRWNLGGVWEYWQFQIAHLRASRTHSRGQVGWFDVFWVDIQSSVSKRKLYRKSKMAMSSCPLYRLQTCDLVVIPREN